jgi:hypothetical protein
LWSLIFPGIWRTTECAAVSAAPADPRRGSCYLSGAMAVPRRKVLEKRLPRGWPDEGSPRLMGFVKGGGKG